MTLKLDLIAQILGTYDGPNDIARPRQDIAVNTRQALASGTGAGQADQLFSDTRTLGASATENLDLAGTLTDAFGQALTFVEIAAIYFKASALNTNDVIVGGAVSNGFLGPFGAATHTLALKPGGWLLLNAPNAAAYPVVAATGDLLKVANGGSGTSVDYDVVIIGRSA